MTPTKRNGEAVGGMPQQVAEHYAYIGNRVVEFFDKDETAGSFLREDGEGGFVSGIYRMAREIERLRLAALASPAQAGSVDTLQERVRAWTQECFGEAIAADRVERNDRFIEEALELTQSLGYSAERAHALVDYVFSRPAGEPGQEVGGVMVTLAALCNTAGLDIYAEARREVDRITQPEIVLKIRAKQASKPTGSALPVAAPANAEQAKPDGEEPWREIEQMYQPRLADGYTAVKHSRPGFWLVKGPGPATAFASQPEGRDQ